MEIPLQYAAQAVDLTFFHLEDNPVNIFDWLDLPVVIDVEIGYNWGEMATVHRGVTQEEIIEVLKELRS